jgi:hypothetical protein
MAITIEEFLEQWKMQSLFGERQFKQLNHTLVEGQLLYALSYKAKDSVDGVEKTIEKNRFFQTRVQGADEKDDINPRGDLYVCQQILAQLESDFFKDYNDFIDGEARKKTSP